MRRIARRRLESTPRGTKQSIYLQQDMLDELERESVRQDRSISWLIQQAWRIARGRMAEMQGANDVIDPTDDD